MSRVLVTRALPEANTTAARVAALGHAPVISPVLQIETLPVTFDAAGVQALLFTSAAGVQAFGAQALPALTVGEATAEAARHAGYTQVRNADGAGEGLIALARTLDPAAGALVHVCGEDIASDIAASLTAAGYDARRLIVYRARFAASLTPAALDLLTAPAPDDAVLLHSARGADALGALARAGGVEKTLSGVRALCLSARVAEAASALDFKGVRVASAPRESALLALLGNSDSERA